MCRAPSHICEETHLWFTRAALVKLLMTIVLRFVVACDTALPLIKSLFSVLPLGIVPTFPAEVSGVSPRAETY
jgi:hypothetical protein